MANYSSRNQLPTFPPVSLWTYPQFLASKERLLAANKPPEPLLNNAHLPLHTGAAHLTLMPGISISAPASTND